jgi:hypothetical protein
MQREREGERGIDREREADRQREGEGEREGMSLLRACYLDDFKYTKRENSCWV